MGSGPHPLPQWQEGKPDAPGTYIGFSTLAGRFREEASLYTYDGNVFQHWTGWYDHGVTHWMPTDLPAPDSTPSHGEER